MFKYPAQSTIYHKVHYLPEKSALSAHCIALHLQVLYKNCSNFGLTDLTFIKTFCR